VSTPYERAEETSIYAPDEREAIVAAINNPTHGIDQWILDHAYAPDDIVLGHRGLMDDDETADLHELLDLARPGWRDLFRKDQK
jgi:hypothetical protein